MSDNSTERRSERRSTVDEFYSVEFLLPECKFIYQFKIWNMASRGICVLVKEGSDLLNYIQVGDVLRLKYYMDEASKPARFLRTEIRHITRDESGRFKGTYLVGLSIQENQGASS
jgi:hypothetical protein